jgi:hypothetical protein
VGDYRVSRGGEIVSRGSIVLDPVGTH